MRKLTYLLIALAIIVLVVALSLTLWPPEPEVATTVSIFTLWLFGLSILLFGFLVSRRKVRNFLKRKIPAVTATASPSQEIINTLRTKNQQTKLLLEGLADGLPRSRSSHHFSQIPLHALVVSTSKHFSYVDGIFRKSTHHNLKAKWEEPDIADVVWVITHAVTKPQVEVIAEFYDWAVARGITVIHDHIGSAKHFEPLLETAENADTIFCNDESVSEYVRSKISDASVHVMQYGANTYRYNPVGSLRHCFKAAFHHSTYEPDNKQEAQATDALLDTFARVGRLAISDELLPGPGSYPARLKPYAMNDVDPKLMPDIAKLFPYNLVVAKPRMSQTAQDPDVVNLQALGRGVLSSYSLTTFNDHPLVRLLPKEADARAYLSDQALQDTYRLSQLAATNVVTKFNGILALSEKCRLAGLPEANARRSKILVIADGDYDTVQNLTSKQLYADLKVVRREELHSYRLSDYGYVTLLGQNNYHPNHIQDLLAAFYYTDALFVTAKATSRETLTRGEAHEFVDEASDRFNTLVSTDHKDALSFLLGAQQTISGRGYAIPLLPALRFDESGTPDPPQEYQLSVIIPVYNNGQFLISKAIPSLRLNESWQNMEVILVDDGSDTSTVDICRTLASENSNIKFFSFMDGGSGSASRPRNKGIELSNCELITFLDPDNEISPYGYDRLLDHWKVHKASNPSVEFVSGYQVKVSSWQGNTGRHSHGQPELITDFHEHFLSKGIFPVISTQCAVISRDLLQRENLRFVEKAVGQDTLFGWELIFKARAGVFVDDAYLLYYADRSDSVTNAVGAKYFSRVLVNEVAKEKFLREEGLLGIYVESHMPNFVKNWYLPRLERVKQSEYHEARHKLAEILNLYGKTIDEYEKL